MRLKRFGLNELKCHGKGRILSQEGFITPYILNDSTLKIV